MSDGGSQLTSSDFIYEEVIKLLNCSIILIWAVFNVSRL